MSTSERPVIETGRRRRRRHSALFKGTVSFDYRTDTHIIVFMHKCERSTRLDPEQQIRYRTTEGGFARLIGTHDYVQMFMPRKAENCPGLR